MTRDGGEAIPASAGDRVAGAILLNVGMVVACIGISTSVAFAIVTIGNLVFRTGKKDPNDALIANMSFLAVNAMVVVVGVFIVMAGLSAMGEGRFQRMLGRTATAAGDRISDARLTDVAATYGWRRSDPRLSRWRPEGRLGNTLITIGTFVVMGALALSVVGAQVGRVGIDVAYAGLGLITVGICLEVMRWRSSDHANWRPTNGGVEEGQ